MRGPFLELVDNLSQHKQRGINRVGLFKAVPFVVGSRSLEARRLRYILSIVFASSQINKIEFGLASSGSVRYGELPSEILETKETYH